MSGARCNYQGILNTGLAQLTDDIKARARAWVNSPEHGRFTYLLHTRSRGITELPLPQTRAERGKPVRGGNEEGEEGGGGLPLLTLVKEAGRKRKKKKGGKKEIAAIRAVLPQLNCICALTVGRKDATRQRALPAPLPTSSVSHYLIRADNTESTESWHSAWDQKTVSPLRARGGQGLRDPWFTDLQLGHFTHQQPLR